MEQANSDSMARKQAETPDCPPRPGLYLACTHDPALCLFARNPPSKQAIPPIPISCQTPEGSTIVTDNLKSRPLHLSLMEDLSNTTQANYSTPNTRNLCSGVQAGALVLKSVPAPLEPNPMTQIIDLRACWLLGFMNQFRQTPILKDARSQAVGY